MSQDNLDRLKRLSRMLYGFSYALIVVLVVIGVVLAVMVAIDTTVVSNLYPGIARDPTLVSAPVGFASVALAWISLGLMIHAIVCLMRMFALFGDGRVFDPQAAFWMRRAGVTLFVLAIYSTFGRTLTILLLSLANPAGERQLSIGFEGTQLLSVFVAGVFVLVAHALVIGGEIERENRSIV